VVGQHRHSPDRTPQTCLGLASTGPLHGYGYPLAVFVRIDEDALKEQTKDSSAVNVRCCRRVPQDRQIGRESSNGFAFCGSQMTRLLVLPATVLLLQSALGLKLLFPRALEWTDHETHARSSERTTRRFSGSTA
jgi:hypothetical protein